MACGACLDLRGSSLRLSAGKGNKGAVWPVPSSSTSTHTAVAMRLIARLCRSCDAKMRIANPAPRLKPHLTRSHCSVFTVHQPSPSRPYNCPERLTGRRTSRSISGMAAPAPRSFEPKSAVNLAPPKDDPLPQDYLTKCDGKGDPSA